MKGFLISSPAVQGRIDDFHKRGRQPVDVE